MATKTEVKSTAVAKAPPTVRGMLERPEVRAQLEAILPAHMSLDKVITSVRLAVAQQPALAACKPESVLFSVMAASRLGLEINSPLHHCSLIPYKDECSLMIEYRGYQELARRGGEIRNVEARNVYEGDLFDYSLGSSPIITHKPCGETDDAKITHTYAIAFTKEGKAFAFDVLPREDVERARKVSRFADKPDSPWGKWYGEMARKTAVRRLAKYLPLSAELAAAIELDLRGDTGQPSANIPLIDSPQSVNENVAARTAAALAEVSDKLAGGQPEAPAKAPEAADEPPFP